jgi:hypothetical protein
MDYKQFMQILKEETDVPDSISALNEFVNEFPYFQTAHLMLAKEMFKQQHIRYEKQLKIASAYSPDRNALYSLIHPKKTNIFSTEPVIEHPKYVPEPVADVSDSENLFDAATDNIIPDEEIKINHSPPGNDLIHTEEILNNETVSPFESGHSEKYKESVYEEENEPYIEEELPSADPHEIIRRRLNEILGLAQNEIRSAPVTEDNSESVSQEYAEAKPNEKDQEDAEDKFVHNDLKDIHADTFSEIPSDVNSKPAHQEYQSAKDLIEKIADESNKVIDEIDKAELEHALEASLIQSLEKLPLIDKKTAIQVQDKVQEEPVNSQPTSFLDWLKKSSTGEFGQVEEVHAYDEKSIEAAMPEEITGKAQSNVLIDRFIKEDPRIVASKTEFYSPAIQAKKSITENEDIVSETLAGIYRNQGNIIKARSMYEKLSLLIPEKKAYFAALISEIDTEMNQQNKQDL